MKKREFTLILTALILISNICFGQTVNLPCQDDTDATTGLDRKNWNGGSTAFHSEGYMMNFVLPPASDFDPCKKILVVEVEFIINDIDQTNMPGDCPMITEFYTNLYVGCSDFAPASCPVGNILSEDNFFPITSQTQVFTCPPDEFPFGDVLAVDLIPVANTGCSTGQTMVSAGSISIDYEVCVTLTIGDDFIENPVDLGPDIPICLGETVPIDAGSGYDEYAWDPNGQTSQMITEGVGTYTVTVTDDNGCTDTDDIEVFLSGPSVTITSDDADLTICVDETTMLTANTAETNIEWSNGDSGPSITVGPGSYNVTVTDPSGCMSEDMITISSLPVPIVNIDPSSPTVCDNGVVEVTATTGYAAYNWSDGQTGNPVLLPVGTYTVIVTDGDDCTGETMFVVDNVNSQEAGNDASLVVCNDGSIYDVETLLGPHDNGGVWADEDGSGINLNTNDDAVDFSGVAPGDYDFTYTISGIAPCPDDIATISVEVNGQGNAGSDNSASFCNDQTNVDVESLLGSFDNVGTWTDNDGAGIDLNANASNVDLSGIAPGSYDFTYSITGTPPCVNDQATITLNISASVNAGSNNNITFCTGEMNVDIAALLGTSDTGGNWTDQDGAGIDLNANDDNVDFSGVTEGVYDFTYTVFGTAPCGNDIATITVTVESGADAGDDNVIAVCEGGDFDLFDGISSDATTGGSFNDDDGSGALSGSVFNSTGLAGQSFTFTYSVGMGGDCGTDEAVITVDVVSTVTAGIDSPNNTACVGDLVDLFDLIPDADMGGVFLDSDGTGALSGSIFDTNISGNGTWNFEYMIGDDVICPADVSQISIDVSPAPTISYNAGSLLCDGDCYTIEFTFTGTPDFQYNLNVFDETSVLITTFNPATVSNPDTLTVCNFGGSGQISNDTLDISNSSFDWYIVPSMVQDMNCTISLDPDTIFIQAEGEITTSIDNLLCPDGSVEVNNNVYDIDNPMGSEMLTAVSGCDSIVNIDLQFFEPADSLLNPTLCSGSEVIVNGNTYDELNPTGTETFPGGSAMGCDSIVNIELMFDNMITNTFDESICNGDSIFLEGAWQFDDGTYIDNFITADNCDSMVTTILTVEQEIIENFNETICNGDSIFLAGDWQFDAGIYEDLFTAVDGCDSTVSTMLTVEFCQVNLDINALGNVCFGGMDGSIKITIEQGDAPYDISWTGQNTGISGNLSNQNAEVEICIENLTSDEYDIVITGASGATVYSDLISVNDLNPAITAVFDITNPSCPSVADGSIEASIENAQGALIYDWSPNVGMSGNVTGLSDGTYFLTTTDEMGCSSEFEIILEAGSDITYDLASTDISCLGINDGSITLTNLSNVGPSVSVIVNGTPIEDPYLLEDLTAGIYNIEINDPDGCLISDVVEILEGPAVGILDYTLQYQIEAGDSIQIDGNPLSATQSFQWSPSTSLSCDTCANPIAFPLSSQMYTLTAVDPEGCSETISINITVTAPDETIYLANIFSPDGNGVNDFLEVHLDAVSTGHLSIFDRWGNLVFDQTNTIGENIIWDGRFNGSVVLPGVYVYLLEYEDFNGDTQLKDGQITIIR